MFSRRSIATAGFPICAITAGILGLTLTLYGGTATAQEADDPGAPPAAPAKPAPKPKPKPKPAAAAPAKPPEKPPEKPAAAPAQAAALAQPVVQDVSAKLRENAAGTCSTQLNAIASETMGAVGQFNTASHWTSTAGDRRLVSVSIGQRYADGSAVPMAATNVVAAPSPQGGCDAVAFQVVPSPLSCTKIREALLVNGKQLGDLAGIPLIQDGSGQAMLVSTSANTCVIVGVRTAYAK